MSLKILAPFQTLLVRDGVKRIVAETRRGFVGLWPHRLDCAAALIPGILTFETVDSTEQYVAVDRGVLLKTGREVRVSVRNAVVGGDLGKLRERVDQQSRTRQASDRQSRELLTKMESEIALKATHLQP
jgi:F-type H+-transporting ATPase subunit epsilon